MKQELLLDKLKKYGESDFYPFHMPGHKRQAGRMGFAFPDPYSIDITEIDGFDNLHHPEDLLKESLEWMAGIYGADESWYLVNGSSCGLLSAISGCTSHRGKLLISRNCHKAVYHGVFQNELEVEYVYPQTFGKLGIQGGILPEDVEKKLDECPDIQAVLIVSPTYDGIVSDIKKIAELVHARRLPLIVDEAHGAHFPFGKEGECPVSALQLGADVVIQSLHKTLPSFTQTAVLHMNARYLGEKRMEKIRRYLSIYQSSSPSYLFMAAMEKAVAYMDQEGRARLEWLYKEIRSFREACRDLKHIHVPGRDELLGDHAVFDVDESKLILSMAETKKDGLWLGERLRQDYHIELEMSAVTYGLALTSLWDQEEGFARLSSALHELDRELFEPVEQEHRAPKITDIRPERAYSIYQAMEEMENQVESLQLEKCSERIAAEFVYLYPPGIPCLVPGEKIENEMIQLIDFYRKSGFSIQGIRDFKGKSLQVLK